MASEMGTNVMIAGSTLTLGLRLIEVQPSEALIGHVKAAKQQGTVASRQPAVVGALVGDAQRERAFDQAISEIDKYRHLPRNWDTYGGVPTSDRAATFSLNLLQQLKAKIEIAPPRMRPVSGGVFLEWRTGIANLYFEIDEKSVLFCHERGDAVLTSGEDAAFDVRKAKECVEVFHGIA
jgi:hypothetical protein